MNRYEHIINERLDLPRKKRRYNSSLLPKIESSTEDIYIIAREGDRLDMLAFEYYEDHKLWWVLAEANKLGKGTLDCPAGQRIRIPASQEWYSVLKKFQKGR